MSWIYSISDTRFGWAALKDSKAGLDNARFPATSMMLSLTGLATVIWAAAFATKSAEAISSITPTLDFTNITASDLKRDLS